MASRKLSSIIKELDEITQILTGNNIPSLAKHVWEEMRGAKPIKELTKTEDSPYKILGLEPNCIPSDIVASYRKLAKKYHPDNLETGDESKFKKVTAAYEKLCLQRGIK